MMGKEIWKPVVLDGESWPYEVSNQGRVRRSEGLKGRTHKGRVLKPIDNGKGYLNVVLSNGIKDQKREYIHRLVLEAFSEREEGKTECNHIDGDKGNNNIDNLEWVTRAYNCQHSYDTGLRERPDLSGKNNPFYGKTHTLESRKSMSKSKKGKYVGEKHWNSKLSDEERKEIISLLKNTTMLQKEIAAKFGIARSTVSTIKMRLGEICE